MNYIETPRVSMASPDLLSDLKTCQAPSSVQGPWISGPFYFPESLGGSLITSSRSLLSVYLLKGGFLKRSRKLPSSGSNPQALFSSGNHQTFSIWLVCSTYAIMAKGSFRGQSIRLSSLHHLVCRAWDGAFCVLLTTVAISTACANTRMLTALHKLGTGKGAGGPEP